MRVENPHAEPVQPACQRGYGRGPLGVPALYMHRLVHTRGLLQRQLNALVKPRVVQSPVSVRAFQLFVFRSVAKRRLTNFQLYNSRSRCRFALG